MNLTYDWMINRDLNLRIEPYFQYLYDLPVENNSSFLLSISMRLFLIGDLSVRVKVRIMV